MGFPLPNQPTLEEHMKNIMPKTLTIEFGVLSFSIERQLRQQRYKYNKKDVKYFQELKESIIHLRVAHILTDNQFIKAKQKLFKKIQKHVREHNK